MNPLDSSRGSANTSIRSPVFLQQLVESEPCSSVVKVVVHPRKLPRLALASKLDDVMG